MTARLPGWSESLLAREGRGGLEGRVLEVKELDPSRYATISLYVVFNANFSGSCFV